MTWQHLVLVGLFIAIAVALVRSPRMPDDWDDN